MSRKRGRQPGELVFPTVELVAHIPWPHHPLGRYVKHRQHIELSRRELAKRSPEIRRFAVYHEAGHWWRCERVPVGMEMPLEDEEAFADAFAFFFTDPGQLRATSRAMMLALMTTDEEGLTRHFVEGVVETLEKEISQPSRR